MICYKIWIRLQRVFISFSYDNMHASLLRYKATEQVTSTVRIVV